MYLCRYASCCLGSEEQAWFTSKPEHFQVGNDLWGFYGGRVTDFDHELATTTNDLFIYLSIYISIYLYVYLTYIYLSIYQTINVAQA